jgi:thioester reductase-like protein
MTMSDTDLLAARSLEIGIDSLVSVDIRSWFLKKFQVSVPVLKIMGDETMANIVQIVIDDLPSELTPLIVEATNDRNDATDTSTSVESSIVDNGPLKGSPIPSAVTTPDHGDHNSNEGGILKYTGTGDIDWEEEASLSPDLATLPRVLNPAIQHPAKVIVLTGASGLLGHHLIDYLLERTPATKIYCPAVRRLASKLAGNELRLDPRVQYFEGQLAEPRLGLSANAAEMIFNTADLVIHNGADTSHLKYFADLRASNVGSTRTITALCLPRRIPLHYVSSAGLAILYNGPIFPPVRVTDRENRYPTTDGVFGYMSSKWTNERFLEQVAEKYGLPVVIHRPSTILREGADAQGIRAELDWVNALLHWCQVINAVPLVKHNSGCLDLVRVSTACDSILHKVLARPDSTEVCYTHQVGDIVLPLKSLQNIGAERDKELALLPMQTWVDKAVAAGLHPAIATLIEMIDTPDAPEYPRLAREIGGAATYPSP